MNKVELVKKDSKDHKDIKSNCRKVFRCIYEGI